MERVSRRDLFVIITKHEYIIIIRSTGLYLYFRLLHIIHIISTGYELQLTMAENTLKIKMFSGKMEDWPEWCNDFIAAMAIKDLDHVLLDSPNESSMRVRMKNKN